MQGVVSTIAGQPFVAALGPDMPEFLASCAAEADFQPGEYVFHEGGSAETFYLIAAGSVALEVAVPGRGALTLETLGPGEPLGWSWLFPPYRWHFDARAMTPLQLIAFSGPCLRAKAESDHDFGYRLMTHLAGKIVERLQATRLRLTDVYGDVHGS
jgi:CRP-like cAMP-binding protein